MKYEAINFKNKFCKFSDHWAPKVIAEINDYQIKLVKIKGELAWHNHKDTDEVFMVLTGKMSIEFRNGKVQISEGEMFVVKKGFAHRTYAKDECEILIIKPREILNSPEFENELRAEDDVWI